MTSCSPNCPVVKQQLRDLVNQTPWLQEKYGGKPGKRAPPSTPSAPSLQEVATSTPSIPETIQKKKSQPGFKSRLRFPDGNGKELDGEEPKKEPVRGEEPKKEPVRGEEPKKEPVRREEPKKEPVRREEPKKEPVRREEPRKEPVRGGVGSKGVPRVPSEKENYPASQHSSDRLSEFDRDRELEFNRELQVESEIPLKSQRSYADEDRSRLRPGEFKREPFINPNSSHNSGSSNPKKQRKYYSEELERTGSTRPVRSTTSYDEDELESDEDFEPEAWEDNLMPGDQGFEPNAQSTPKDQIKGSRERSRIRRPSDSEEEDNFRGGKRTPNMQKTGSAGVGAGPSKSSHQSRTKKGKPTDKAYKPKEKDELAKNGRRPDKSSDKMPELDECDFDNVCLCRMHCVIRGLKKHSFVRSFLTAVVLFAIGLKLCAELDAWSIPTPGR